MRLRKVEVKLKKIGVEVDEKPEEDEEEKEVELDGEAKEEEEVIQEKEIQREPLESVTYSNKNVSPSQAMRSFSTRTSPSPAMRSFSPRTSSIPAMRSFSPRTSPSLATRGAVRPATPRPPLRLVRPVTPRVMMPPPPAGAVRGTPRNKVRPLQPGQQIPQTTSILSRLQKISGLTIQTVSQSTSKVEAEAACSHLETLQRYIQDAAAQVSFDRRE